MKTLEQVIVDCKEEIKDCQIDLDGIAELLEKHPERKEAFAHNIDDYKKRMNYNYQLAAWLFELQERRKADSCEGCLYEDGSFLRCVKCKRNKEYYDRYEPERRTE